MENQNQILDILKVINDKLDRHTEILDKHTRILDEHTRILDEHTRILDEHSSRLDEHTQILRALEHSSEVHKAEMDKLNHTVANIEGEVKGIREDLRTIEMVTSKNWNDIVKLKSIR